MIYLIGGYWKTSASSNNALSIESNSGAMEYISSLKFGRIHHGCATFDRENKTFIIVAGANRVYDNYYSVSKTSEIFDVNENIWTEGKFTLLHCTVNIFRGLLIVGFAH